jgi:hypothetical protein
MHYRHYTGGPNAEQLDERIDRYHRPIDSSSVFWPNVAVGKTNEVEIPSDTTRLGMKGELKSIYAG